MARRELSTSISRRIIRLWVGRVPGDGCLEVDVGQTAFRRVELGFFGAQLREKSAYSQLSGVTFDSLSEVEQRGPRLDVVAPLPTRR